MESIKMKSTIMCGACIQKVTPSLDALVGAGNWQVDLTNKDRVLSIESEDVKPEQVSQALAAVGYEAQILN